MNYNNFIYFFNGKIAYVLLGVLAATLAGSLGYLIWLLLKQKTDKFYVKNAIRFLKLVLACYLVPVILFIYFLLLKGAEYGDFFTLVTTPMTGFLLILTVLWLIQLVIVSVYHYIHYQEKRNMFKNSTEIQQEEICAVMEKWKKRLGIKKKVGLYANDDISSPSIIYNKGYQILLPMAIMEKEDYDIVILHELMHLKRGDLALKNVGFLVNIIHAFNPLVSRLREQLEKWVEVGCDLDCCELAREEISRQDYFNCMLRLKERSQHRKYAGSICYFVENQELTEFRVDMMLKMKGESLKVPVWSFVLALCLMLAISGGSMVLTTDMFRIWFECSLDEVAKIQPTSSIESAEGDIFADFDIVYADINILNQTDSTDFTLNAKEAWVFDVSQEHVDAVFVSIYSENKDYRVGYIDTAGQVVYIDGKVDLVENIGLEQNTIARILIQSLSDDSMDVEMVVMKKPKE